MHAKFFRRGVRCTLLCCLLASLGTHNGRADATPPRALAVSVGGRNCIFSVGEEGGAASVLRAGIAAKVNQAWLHSSDYPKCSVFESNVKAALGSAHQWRVEYSGLSGKPDLGYTLRSYRDKPFADVQAEVINRTGGTLEVEDIRSVEVLGEIDLGGPTHLDRVLSDSFSEDRPAMRIHDLGDTPQQVYRGVGSQLIYNRQTHLSFFAGALSSERFLTILRLHTGAGAASDPTIRSYEIDSTGTTEMTSENSLLTSPPEDRIELSLPVATGECLTAERLLLSVDRDPHRQLDGYGALIRKLHSPRPAGPTPIGWWSWTAYYFGLNQGAALTNAEWLAQNLSSYGYEFFHIDEGYQYSRGEYATPDAALFPDGMASLERKVTALGLKPGIWTAPFQVGQRSWVYQNHQDWLVHNAGKEPIVAGSVDNKEPIYILDVTNPGAQQYLRQTYTTMSQNWGIRYFKLDFMEDSAVEGYYYKPHTTALEAQRIGLGIIRNAVGNSGLLDKDGSAMLNTVGYVDEGRISQDTGHSFNASKDAATGIAARYYMNRNFFVSDPDAFSVSMQTIRRQWHGGERPLTLNEAEVSIALAAVSGGMFEIGDDLPTLGANAERLALVKNRDLLNMARIGHASTPIDLMSYRPEDEQPSIFLLREDARQSILTIFNWTEKPRVHTVQLSALGFAAHDVKAVDVFTQARVPVSPKGSLVMEEPADSVRMLRIENVGVPPAYPAISIKHESEAHSGENITFSAVASSSFGEPVLNWGWKFGDGVSATGATVHHTYTAPGKFNVQLETTFLNGVTAKDSFTVLVSGTIGSEFTPAQKRRFVGPD